MKTISVKDLAYILGFNKNTVKVWLDGYRFTKFRVDKDFVYSKEFISTLIEFLEMKYKYKEIKKLQKYVNNFNTPEK